MENSFNYDLVLISMALFYRHCQLQNSKDKGFICKLN